MQGAAYLGYKLVSRTTEQVKVQINNLLHTFDVLATLEFNSDRKRMSIIVRTPDNRLLLMCKGADSIILKRLATGEPGVQTVTQHLVRQKGVCRACAGRQEPGARGVGCGSVHLSPTACAFVSACVSPVQTCIPLFARRHML